MLMKTIIQIAICDYFLSKSIRSISSFSMAKIAKAESLSSVIVVRGLVFKRFKAENERSASALVTGMHK